jgi:hypothetical protein
MQLAVLSIFLGVWLLVFWVGSVALEMTGMERTKARFQALSAMSGTGFYDARVRIGSQPSQAA